MSACWRESAECHRQKVNNLEQRINVLLYNVKYGELLIFDSRLHHGTEVNREKSTRKRSERADGQDTQCKEKLRIEQTHLFIALFVNKFHKKHIVH